MDFIEELPKDDLEGAVDIFEDLIDTQPKDLTKALCILAFAFVDAAEPKLPVNVKWYKSLILARHSVVRAKEIPELNFNISQSSN